MPYDLFLGIPVHCAPEVVLASDLAEDGWIPVDPATFATRSPGRLRRRRRHQRTGSPCRRHRRRRGGHRRRSAHRRTHRRPSAPPYDGAGAAMWSWETNWSDASTSISSPTTRQWPSSQHPLPRSSKRSRSGGRLAPPAGSAARPPGVGSASAADRMQYPGGVHLGIATVPGHQLIVGSDLHDPPSSTTTIRSARMAVDRRWAMRMAVRFSRSTSRAALILVSDWRSVLEMYAGVELQAVTVVDGTEWLTRPGTAGRPVLGEIEIRDSRGRRLPPGETGGGPLTFWTRRISRPPRRLLLGLTEWCPSRNRRAGCGDGRWDEPGAMSCSSRRRLSRGGLCESS